MIARHLDPHGWRRNVNSRDLAELLPTVHQMCAHFLNACARQNIEVVVVSTFRDPEAQAALYRVGRQEPGAPLTYWPPLSSWHQWRCAFDVVPLYHGRPIAARPAPGDLVALELWHALGEIAEVEVGLEWGGRFPAERREFGHFQHTYGREIKHMLHGGASALPETIDGPVTIYGAAGSRWQRLLGLLRPARGNGAHP